MINKDKFIICDTSTSSTMLSKLYVSLISKCFQLHCFLIELILAAMRTNICFYFYRLKINSILYSTEGLSSFNETQWSLMSHTCSFLYSRKKINICHLLTGFKRFFLERFFLCISQQFSLYINHFVSMALTKRVPHFSYCFHFPFLNYLSKSTKTIAWPTLPWSI